MVNRGQSGQWSIFGFELLSSADFTLNIQKSLIFDDIQQTNQVINTVL